MQPIQSFIPLLETPKNIVITTHYKPDGDAIGSILAMYHYLTRKGHKAMPVVPSEVPPFLNWMPGTEAIVNYESNIALVQKALQEAEIIICLDFNAFSRVQHMEPFLANAGATKVMIDHHMYPAPVWDYGTSEPDKSSTCEMVFDFIRNNGDLEMIDPDIAACLYTGTMTDTGSFRFAATTASVHDMIAELKRRGLEHTHIHEAVYDSWSVDRMRFIGFMLIERMEIFPQWNAGLITVSRKDLQRFSLGPGDTEGLVNYPLSIAGIRFSTLISERGDDIRLSFRSKGDFDVNSFAREHFNGGGHFNASGGRSSQSFSDTIAYFKKILSDIHPR